MGWLWKAFWLWVYLAKPLIFMVPQEGIEPPTHALRICFRLCAVLSAASNWTMLQIRKRA